VHRPPCRAQHFRLRPQRKHSAPRRRPRSLPRPARPTASAVSRWTSAVSPTARRPPGRRRNPHRRRARWRRPRPLRRWRARSRRARHRVIPSVSVRHGRSRVRLPHRHPPLLRRPPPQPPRKREQASRPSLQA
jgi:hypothetical protein